jgi:transcriptional regulator with XRE-family HTH domain
MENLRIKEVCKEKNISLAELSEKLNIKRVSLSRIMNGNPQIQTLEKIAAALNVHLSDLLTKPENTLTGFIEHKGKIYPVKSVQDLKKLVENIAPE